MNGALLRFHKEMFAGKITEDSRIKDKISDDLSGVGAEEDSAGVFTSLTIELV